MHGDAAACLAAAKAYCTDLARNVSPASMAAIKAQIHAHASLAVGGAADESAALMAASFSHPDFKEGVGSFVQKRAPSFQGLGAGTIHDRLTQ